MNMFCVFGSDPNLGSVCSHRALACNAMAREMQYVLKRNVRAWVAGLSGRRENYLMVHIRGFEAL